MRLGHGESTFLNVTFSYCCARTVLTLSYTLTQTRINQYRSLTSSPHVCKTVPAHVHPPSPAIPERPRAAHSRGSAATESPRASAISCAKEICTATEMRCVTNAM